MTDSVYQPLRFNNANYGTMFNPMQEENLMMPMYGQQAQAPQALSANASASTPDFSEQAKVINGASQLFIDAFGDDGRHARSAIGSVALPLGLAVEVESIWELKEA